MDTSQPKLPSTIVLLLVYIALNPSSARVWTKITKKEWNTTLPENIPTYCLYCRCDVRDNDFITDCSHLGLLLPPKKLLNTTTELYMNNNNLKSVRSRYFTNYPILRILDLSENVINIIEIGAFSKLVSLEELYLHGQNTKQFIAQAVFNVGVFEGLSRLKKLTTHHNLDIREAWVSKVPSTAMINLTSLEYFSLDGVTDVVFDEEFLGLNNLTTIFMSGIEGTCEIGSLSSKSFIGVPNLRNLTMEKCRINKIGQGTFWPLTKLEYLDLSWNVELEIAEFAKVAGELQYTNLDILKINAIHNPDRAGTEILRSDMRGIRDLKVTELHMNDNGIQYIDYGVLGSFPQTLKRLYMRRNKLIFGIIISEAVFNNPSLEVFDAADQLIIQRPQNYKKNKHGDWIYSRHSRDISSNNFASAQNSDIIDSLGKVNKTNKDHMSIENVNENVMIARDYIETEKVTRRRTKRELPHVTLNLKVLICSGSYSTMRVKSRLNFTDTTNSIEYIDLSRNFINILEEEAFDGLEKLKFLNLSGNFIERYPDNVFVGLDSLEVLDISNNLFHDKLGQDYAGAIFEPLGQLTHLNLSSNRLYVVQRNAFRFLTNLKHLDLSENYIDTLGISLYGLNSLSFLVLKNNRIQTIPEDSRKELSKFATNHVVKVDLRLNKLACNCESLPFLDWLFSSSVEFVGKQTYYCHFNNGSLKSLNESTTSFVDILREECRDYTDIIIACSTGASFLIAVVCCVTVYINRWKLRYLYYMAKVKLDQHGEEKIEQNQFVYDVFLSYGDGDRQFVATELMERMEKEFQMKLIIRDRDFEIGELIAVNISKAIKISKKTFLLVSRHFLANKWCNFEMNMARMEEIHKKRDVLVIIFLEAIPAHALPIDLVDILRSSPNIDLPKDVNARFAFWQACKDYANA